MTAEIRSRLHGRVQRARARSVADVQKTPAVEAQRVARGLPVLAEVPPPGLLSPCTGSGSASGRSNVPAAAAGDSRFDAHIASLCASSYGACHSLLLHDRRAVYGGNSASIDLASAAGTHDGLSDEVAASGFTESVLALLARDLPGKTNYEPLFN